MSNDTFSKPSLRSGASDPAEITSRNNEYSRFLAKTKLQAADEPDIGRLESDLNEVRGTAQRSEAQASQGTPPSATSVRIETYYTFGVTDPIGLARVDTITLLDTFRKDEKKWQTKAGICIGVASGVLVNWVTSGAVALTLLSIVMAVVFVGVGVLFWQEARTAELRADSKLQEILGPIPTKLRSPERPR